MLPKRWNLPVMLLAALGAAVLVGGVLWLAAGSSIADAVRGVTGGGPRLVLRPEEVPACGAAWRVVDVPNPGFEYNELRAVAAASPQEVWTVGTQGNEESARTLIERWDGTRWNVVPSPSVRLYSNHLYGVAVIAPGPEPAKDVWAVGGYHREAGYWQTLTLHWDGQEWTRVPSPSPASISILNAVSATASGDVWAVGEYSAGSQGVGSQPLALHWDGSRWSVVPVQGSAGNAPQDAVLNAVAAISPDDVWAAGSIAGAAEANDRPFVTHWDGKAWSTVQSEGTGTIWGLAAVSKEDVWAVGNNGPRSLIMRWDGTRWSAVPSPNPGDSGNTLSAVAAVAPNDVWAVGSHSSGGPDKTLAMHWDGANWTPVPSPSAADFLDALWGVAAAGSHEVWAAGSYISDSAGTSMALVERYSDPCHR